MLFPLNLWADGPNDTAEPLTVRVAVLSNFPPEYMLDNSGKPAGFAIDIIEEVGRRAGLKLVYTLKDNWLDMIEALKSGEADLIPNQGITEDRKEWADFTSPVATFPVKIFVRDITGGIQDLNDLNGRKAAVVRLNAGDAILSRHEAIDTKIYEDVETALFHLLSGQVDALVFPEPILLHLVRQSGLADHIKPVGKPLQEIKRAISVRKGNVMLLNRLEQAVKGFVGSETYKDIYIKWYGEPEPFWTLTKVTFLLTGVFTLLFILAFLWRYKSLMRLNRLLNENMRERKKSDEMLRQTYAEMEQRIEERTAELLRANQSLEEEIIEREQVEHQLRLAKSCLDNASIGIFWINPDGKIIYANEAGGKKLGYSSEEMTGLRVSDIDSSYPTEKRDKFWDKLCRKKAMTFETLHRTQDGRMITVEVTDHYLRFNDQDYEFAFVTDITERKKAEEILRESEERFRAIFDRSPVGIALVGMDYNLIRANSAYCGLIGYNESELKKLTLSDFTHPDDIEENLWLQGKLSRGEIPSFQMEKRFIRKDGETVHGLLVAALIRGDRGEPLYFLGQVLDITQRKQMEHKLKESENRFRFLFNCGNDAIFVHGIREGAPGTFMEVNDVACRMLGYTREELLNMSPKDIDKPEYTRDTPQVVQKLTAGEQILFERIFVAKDGKEIPVEINAHLFRLEGHLTVLSVARDISERKQIEAEKARLAGQIQQAQKMEALGTLAGGIAHDFNNILSPIMGYCEMCIDDLPPGSLVQQNLREILNAALRARDLVQQILSFGRQKEHERKPMKIQHIIKEALKLLRSTIPTTIVFQEDIDPECGLFVGDPTQIHQIIMNLCTNAYHAMEISGGTLDVRLKEIRIQAEDRVGKKPLTPGKYIRLTVKDTGGGIRPDIVGRIFDPYFTTKEQGKGTGLGLSVVHGIVASYGGDISVYSEIGKGTEFSIYFPGVERLKPDEARISEPPIKMGHEHVLIVDDEFEIVKLEQMMLERLGYRVTSRTSSREALEAFRSQPDTFDVVITDMTMPGITGTQLALKLTEIKPDIPIILCTGFSELITRETAENFGIKEFLAKPIIKSQMAQAIRKVLGK
jgi:PAS domain S-box-containing protein